MIAAALGFAAPWLRYWKLAVMAGLLLALGLQTYRIASLKRAQAERIAAIERDRAKAIANTLAAEREAARITAEREQAHEKTIADLRASAARRLQSLTGRAQPLPSVPDAAFQADAGAGRHRLCIETAFAVSLMLSADENTQQLIDLQAWIRDQQTAASRRSTVP